MTDPRAPSEGLQDRRCAACRAWFAPSRSDARTCSPRCRTALSRQASRTAGPVIRDTEAPIRDNRDPEHDEAGRLLDPFNHWRNLNDESY